MAYSETNLIAGERLVYRARIHWKVFIWPALWLLAGLLALASNSTIWLILVLIGLVAIIKPYVTYTTTEFGLTDRRIIRKAGLIRRHALELQLAKIEGVEVDQGILGRMLNYGTIIITGTGGTRGYFPAIAAPFDLQRAIEEQLRSS